MTNRIRSVRVTHRHEGGIAEHTDHPLSEVSVEVATADGHLVRRSLADVMDNGIGYVNSSNELRNDMLKDFMQYLEISPIADDPGHYYENDFKGWATEEIETIFAVFKEDAKRKLMGM